MMKKFTRILICLILCVFGIGLIGCGDNRTPEEKAFNYPKANADVVGNGGLSVQVGNHIYFVNGFQKAAESKRYGKFTHAGLMLTELNANGDLVTEENGALEDKAVIDMSKKLSGFEATDVAVFGNYLYFTSVCQADDSKTEKWANGLVDFNRIKLNKTGSVERIYRSKSNNDKLSFKYYQNEDGKVSLVVFEQESNKLVKVSTDKKTSTILTDVQNVVFADNYNEVVCVTSTGDMEVPYKSYVVNAVDGTKTELFSHSALATAKYVSNGKAYIQENDNLTCYDLSNKANYYEVLYGFSSYVSVHVLPNTDVIVALSKENNGTLFEYFENNTGIPSTNNKVLDSEVADAKVIGFANGSIIYHNGSGVIKTLSYANRNLSVAPETAATISDINSTYFDINGNDLYFFKKVGSNEYLHRLTLVNGEGVEEFVGVYLQADIPEVEKTEE